MALLAKAGRRSTDLHSSCPLHNGLQNPHGYVANSQVAQL